MPFANGTLHEYLCWRIVLRMCTWSTFREGILCPRRRGHTHLEWGSLSLLSEPPSAEVCLPGPRMALVEVAPPDSDARPLLGHLESSTCVVSDHQRCSCRHAISHEGGVLRLCSVASGDARMLGWGKGVRCLILGGWVWVSTFGRLCEGGPGVLTSASRRHGGFPATAQRYVSQIPRLVQLTGPAGAWVPLVLATSGGGSASPCGGPSPLVPRPIFLVSGPPGVGGGE